MLTLIPKALAASMPLVPCGFLPGCGNPVNALQEAFIPEIARIALNLVIAFAILFVIVGGARFLLAFGREEEHTKALKTILWALGAIIVAMTSHRIVIMLVSETYVTGPAYPILELFQTAVRAIMLVLNAVFLIVLLLGSMRMVTAHGRDEEISKARKTIIFAILGVAFINIAPALIKAVIGILP